MPALRPLSWRTFVRFAESRGWGHDRTRGDHIVYVKPGLARPLVIRRLKDIPVFELRANLRTMGVRPEDLIDFLRGH